MPHPERLPRRTTPLLSESKDPKVKKKAFTAEAWEDLIGTNLRAPLFLAQAAAPALKKAQGAIVNIADMQPQTEDSHCASRPARYALEMNRGWFAARGIKPGIRIGGIPGVKH